MIISDASNLKVWDINNWECLCTIYEEKITFSCFLNDMNKNENYIIVNTNPIRLYDMAGKKVKNLKSEKLVTNVIWVYYDKKFNKNYIITGNNNDIAISYDYDENKLYHKYQENKCKFYWSTVSDILVSDNKDKVNLIVLNFFEGIKIYDFHSGIFEATIELDLGGKFTMCLWNNEYLFVGFKETIKLIDIKALKSIKNLNGHKSSISTIKKFIHPIYGECLVSQGNESDDIKLWIIQK